LPLVVCMASAVTRTPPRGRGSSSGRKCVTSFAFPAFATLSWAMTRPGTWVTAASRWTFLFWPALASLRSLPSTAAAGRAGTWPGSPVTAGSSQGWDGCGRNQPSSRSSRKLPAAGGFRFPFFRFSSRLRCPSRRCAAYAAGIAGSSAACARHADSAASSPSASIMPGSRSSVLADGAARSPVRGLTRQPCAASTSWSQRAAACAIASGPPCPAATPATATDTSGASWCRIPRGFRMSSSRPASACRNGTGSGTVPAGRWWRMHSISHDEPTGVVLNGDGLSGLAPGSSPRATPSHQAHPHRNYPVSRTTPAVQSRTATTTKTPQAPLKPTDAAPPVTHCHSDFGESLDNLPG